MVRAFAIGDIHGCIHTFRKLLFEKIKIEQQDIIYCLGDYIDRGNDSKSVLDLILSLRSENYNIQTLRGNHEQMLLDSLHSPDSMEMWMYNGADATLASFGVNSPNELDPKYLQFFRETKLFIEYKNYILVHAGLNFSLPEILEDKEAMLWARGFSDHQPSLGDRIMLHGHTPIPLKKIQKQNGNCINVDGGCVYTEFNSLGNLVAFDLNEKKYYWEPNCE